MRLLFRIYNTEKKEYTNDVSIYGLKNLDARTDICEMFTGKRDYDFRNIYEGDILAVSDTNELLGEVHFDSTKGKFIVYNGLNKYELGELNNIKVIGNIREDKKLDRILRILNGISCVLLTNSIQVSINTRKEFLEEFIDIDDFIKEINEFFHIDIKEFEGTIFDLASQIYMEKK